MEYIVFLIYTLSQYFVMAFAIAINLNLLSIDLKILIDVLPFFLYFFGLHVL